MSLGKTELFLADLELQYEWYAQRAGLEIAEKYIEAVEETCDLIKRQPW